MFQVTTFRRVLVLAAVAAGFGAPANAASPVKPGDEAHARWELIERYCFDCHNTTDWAGKTAFDIMSFDELAADAKVWESAVRKLRAGFMPPPGTVSRPDQQSIERLIGFLETRLDAAQVQPA